MMCILVKALHVPVVMTVTYLQDHTLNVGFVYPFVIIDPTD
jgi:hypothetical protein